MALLFADGFDLYDDQADVVAGGLIKVEGSTHTHSLTGGRYGGGCIGGTSVFPGWGVTCVKAPGDTFWFSFAYYHDGAGSTVGNGDYWIYPRDGGSAQHFIIFHKASGEIYLVDQTNTVVAISAAVLTSGVFHWVEVKVVLGTNNSNGVMEIRVDGTLVINQTGMDNYNGNNTGNIGFYGSSGSWKIDDIVINDNLGTSFTSATGDCRIDTLRPNGAGGVTAWSGAYTDVDDAFGSSDGDTTFIGSATVGDESRFTATDVPSPSAAIPALQPRVKAKRTDPGARTMRTLLNSSGTEALGTAFTPDLSYVWTRGDVIYQNPNTSGAWNNTTVDAVQVGVEVVS